MAKQYFSLLVRFNKSDLWSVQFGDYDRECVEDEVDSYDDAHATKIIKTAPEQDAIMAKVKELNDKILAKFWDAAMDIEELVADLENISTDDKQAIKAYSIPEVVAEAEYVLSTFHEAGHLNGDALAGEWEHDCCNQAWARGEVRKLQSLIKSYK